jgi:hypothetical protein
LELTLHLDKVASTASATVIFRELRWELEFNELGIGWPIVIHHPHFIFLLDTTQGRTPENQLKCTVPSPGKFLRFEVHVCANPGKLGMISD